MVKKNINSSMQKTCVFPVGKDRCQDHPHNSPYAVTGKNIQCIIYFFKAFQLTIILETIAVINPMKRLSWILTKPHPGVMATNPTTAPMQAPKAETLLPLILSKKSRSSSRKLKQ